MRQPIPAINVNNVKYQVPCVHPNLQINVNGVKHLVPCVHLYLLKTFTM